MAVTATNLTAGKDLTTQSSYTTASITPSGNQLVLALIFNRGGGQETPSLSGNGITWVQVASATIGTNQRLTVLRGMVGSPSSGAVTITFTANQGACRWVIDQFNNVDTTGTNGSGAVVQSATNSDTPPPNTTSLTVTLAAFGSTNNATYGGFRQGSDGGLMTAGSGFTLTGESGENLVEDVASEFKNTNDTTVDATWSSDSGGHEGVAVEIKFAVAAAGGNDWPILRSSHLWGWNYS